MADIAAIKQGNLVRCDVLGDVFFAEVTTPPEKVSPRVYEIGIRRIGAQAFVANQDRYKKVRGRQVKTVYRRLKS